MHADDKKKVAEDIVSVIKDFQFSQMSVIIDVKVRLVKHTDALEIARSLAPQLF